MWGCLISFQSVISIVLNKDVRINLSHFSIALFFQCLVGCRKNVCEKLGLNPEDVELSMGMSNDFEKAVSEFLWRACQVSCMSSCPSSETKRQRVGATWRKPSGKIGANQNFVNFLLHQFCCSVSFVSLLLHVSTPGPPRMPHA